MASKHAKPVKHFGNVILVLALLRKTCHSVAMPKRSSMRKVNRMAASIIDKIKDSGEIGSSPKRRRKNPAAVLLGRRGGKKGGPARARMLSEARRSEIARIAAQARWKSDTE
jgi:hypothetical protein